VLLFDGNYKRTITIALLGALVFTSNFVFAGYYKDRNQFINELRDSILKSDMKAVKKSYSRFSRKFSCLKDKKLMTTKYSKVVIKRVLNSCKNKKDGEGEATALHYVAAAGGSVDVFVDSGADVNLLKSSGVSPLWSSLFSSTKLSATSIRNIEKLINAGADINLLSPSSGHTGGMVTPIHYAATKDARVVLMLLKAGAHTESLDHEGRTAREVFSFNRDFHQSGNPVQYQKSIQLFFDIGSGRGLAEAHGSKAAGLHFSGNGRLSSEFQKIDDSNNQWFEKYKKTCHTHGPSAQTDTWIAWSGNYHGSSRIPDTSPSEARKLLVQELVDIESLVSELPDGYSALHREAKNTFDAVVAGDVSCTEEACDNYKKLFERSIRNLKNSISTCEKEYQSRLSTIAFIDKKKTPSLSFGKLVALSGGVILANKAGLGAEDTVEFMAAYSKDVMGNTTSNINELQTKLSSSYSSGDAVEEFNRKLADVVKQAKEIQAGKVQSNLSAKSSLASQVLPSSVSASTTYSTDNSVKSPNLGAAASSCSMGELIGSAKGYREHVQYSVFYQKSGMIGKSDEYYRRNAMYTNDFSNQARSQATESCESKSMKLRSESFFGADVCGGVFRETRSCVLPTEFTCYTPCAGKSSGANLGFAKE